MLETDCDCKILSRNLCLSAGKLLCNNVLYSIDHRCHNYGHELLYVLLHEVDLISQFIDLRQFQGSDIELEVL